MSESSVPDRGNVIAGSNPDPHETRHPPLFVGAGFFFGIERVVLLTEPFATAALLGWLCFGR